MKRLSLYLLTVAVFAVTLASCNTKAASSPFVYYSNDLVRTSAAGVQDTISVEDTLQVGDTVRMSMMVNGYLSRLTSFIATSDTLSVKVAFEVTPENAKLLADDADPERGRLIFAPDVYLFNMVMRYTPVRAGQHRIDMVASSEAGSPYSPQMWQLLLTATE